MSGEKVTQRYDPLIEQSENIVPGEIKLYSYRFLSLFVYCLMAAVNGFAPQTFVAVSVEIGDLYGQSATVLNVTALCHTLAHSFVVFPANYILDQMGLKTGMILGNGFLILGYLVRILISYDFVFYIVGTYITSFGFIFIMNAATKFSNTWFGVKQSTFINTLLLFLIFASNPVGTFIPVLFIDQHSTKQDVFHVVLYISVALIGIGILGLLVIKQRPPTPANYSSNKIKEKFWESIKHLVKDKNYIMLFLAVTVSWGCVSSFFVTLAWQLKPYGWDSNDVGIILLAANGLGLLGSICVGIYIQKYKKYKKLLMMLITMSTICLGGFWVAFEISSSSLPLYITGSLSGFFLFPFFTTIVDLSNQIAFPIGEATASGFLLSGGQLFGFVLGLAMSLIFDGESLLKTRIGTAVYMILFCFAILFVCLFKENLKKANYQLEKEAKRQSLIIEG